MELASNIFFGHQGLVKRETRFTSKRPAKEIISKIEETAMPLGFDVKKNNFKVKLVLSYSNMQFSITLFLLTTLLCDLGKESIAKKITNKD